MRRCVLAARVRRCPGAVSADSPRLPRPGRARVPGPGRDRRRARAARAQPRRDHLPRDGGPGAGPGGPAGPARRAPGRPGRDRLAELRAAAHVVLRRLRMGPGAGADQLPAGPGRDRLHRQAQRRLGRVRRPGAARCPARPRRPAQVPAGRRRRAVSARGRAPRMGRAGRERHRDDQLHLRHHRTAQGSAAHPPLPLAQRHGLRPAHHDQRP